MELQYFYPFLEVYVVRILFVLLSLKQWIKTSEKLPERLPNVKYSNPKVIVWYKGEVAMLCFNHEHECWDDEGGDDYCCDIESVEYWMPLPNKPLNKQD